MNLSPAIVIHVVSHYLESQSSPEAEKYVFAYTITLSNHGSVAARLLRRHWVITDGNGEVQEVRGDGVVGEQPRLAPGEEYRYVSAAMIPTPVGTMEGEYAMITDGGESFLAEIPRFRLAVPGILH